MSPETMQNNRVDGGRRRARQYKATQGYGNTPIQAYILEQSLRCDKEGKGGWVSSGVYTAPQQKSAPLAEMLTLAPHINHREAHLTIRAIGIVGALGS